LILKIFKSFLYVLVTAPYPLWNKDTGELRATWADGETQNSQCVHCFQLFTLPN